MEGKRVVTLPPAPAGSPPLQGAASASHLLSAAAVHLLDGCLAAAAQLPSRAQQQQAWGNVVCGYSRAVLREAHRRYLATHTAATTAPQRRRMQDDSHDVSSRVPTGGRPAQLSHRADGFAAPAGPEPCGGEPAAGQASCDTEYLDAAFAVLSAAASRYPQLAGEARTMGQVAVGAGAVDGAGGVGDEHGPAPPHQVEQPERRQHSCPFDAYFLAEAFTYRLAAGQLLFGDGGSTTGSGLGTRSGSSSVGAGPGSWPGAAGVAEVESLLHCPILLELCAAAAMVDAWPDMLTAAATGAPGGLAAWLAGGSSSMAGVAAGRQEQDCGMGPDGARCSAVLTTAVRRDAWCLFGVPPPLLCALLVIDGKLRAAVIGALAGVLGRVGSDGGDDWVGADMGSGALPPSCDPEMRAFLQQLGSCFQVLGFDLGGLLAAGMCGKIAGA